MCLVAHKGAGGGQIVHPQAGLLALGGQLGGPLSQAGPQYKGDHHLAGTSPLSNRSCKFGTAWQDRKMLEKSRYMILSIMKAAAVSMCAARLQHVTNGWLQASSRKPRNSFQAEISAFMIASPQVHAYLFKRVTACQAGDSAIKPSIAEYSRALNGTVPFWGMVK